MGTWAKGGCQHDARKMEYYPQPLGGAVTEEVSKSQNQEENHGLSNSESVQTRERQTRRATAPSPSPLVDRKGFSALTFQGLKPRDVQVLE